LSRNKINTGSHVPKIQKRAVKNTAIYTKILIFVTKNNGGSMIHTFFKKSFGKKKSLMENSSLTQKSYVDSSIRIQKQITILEEHNMEKKD